MCSSSNTMTKWLAPPRHGSWFEEERGSGARGAEEGSPGAGRWPASKATISCASPSSLTAKSSRRRSSTGAPARSVTTMSTVTTSAWVGNVGCWPVVCGRAPTAGSTARRAAKRGRFILCSFSPELRSEDRTEITPPGCRPAKIHAGERALLAEAERRQVRAPLAVVRRVHEDAPAAAARQQGPEVPPAQRPCRGIRDVVARRPRRELKACEAVRLTEPEPGVDGPTARRGVEADGGGGAQPPGHLLAADGAAPPA